MNRIETPWEVRLSDRAKRDFSGIVRWSRRTFGEAPASIYAETLTFAIQALSQGPNPTGTRRRDNLVPGLRALHVSRGGRPGRHFVFFRVADADARTIDVLRILHDAMDHGRHVTDDER